MCTYILVAHSTTLPQGNDHQHLRVSPAALSARSGGRPLSAVSDGHHRQVQCLLTRPRLCRPVAHVEVVFDNALCNSGLHFSGDDLVSGFDNPHFRTGMSDCTHAVQ